MTVTASAETKPSSQFYISCPVGFETHLSLEIKEVWSWLLGPDNQPHSLPVPAMTLDRGGVLIQTEFHLGVQLNFFLKTAHRILWRVAEFKARDFPKLFEKVSRISWSRYLKSPNVEWVVAASGSRLNHEKRIETTCEEALQEAFKKESSTVSVGGGQPSVQPTQKIYVRVHDDLCTLSLDTSGEHLHKRGWATMKGEAPLRETLAAFLLREMMAGISIEELGETTLIDPMCGSGTILLEAASLLQPVFSRDFSFLHWRNCPKIYSTPLWRKNYKNLFLSSPFKAYLGFDSDSKALRAAEENLKLLQEKTSLKDVSINFTQADLFSAGEKIAVGKSWCLVNPPYGERLKVQNAESVEASAFSYQDLLAKMVQRFASEKMGVLLPNKGHVKKLSAPEGYSKALEIPFSNGGLDVVFIVFTEARRYPPKK